MVEKFKIKGLTKENFAEAIRVFVRKYKLTYLEAIAELCNANGIEMEDVKPILSDEIMHELRQEAFAANMIKRSGKTVLKFD